MGVINVTPDSFYDGGRFLDPGRAVERGLELVEQGADILDVGGESSRPGSDPVAEEEEMRRVLPVLRGLRGRSKAFLSIDTTKRRVAEAALDAGADIINDISAFRFDPSLLDLAAARGAAVVLMHMLGRPKTMQHAPSYGDVVAEVRTFLEERAAAAREAGVARESVVLDPGIGFGKRLDDNLALINNLPALGESGYPLLVGPSRKSFLGALLDLPAEERLEGTLAAAVLSVVRGAHVLRVHDVRAVSRAVRTAEAVLAEGRETGSREPGAAEESEARHAG
ncbi:MAG: dihydropteroate synthase [Candidatus Aminicenantes bacterium]|nr:dihydropteroate synthase [Candidatus Aminicenantes bacterium]